MVSAVLLGFAEVAVDYYRLLIIHKFVGVALSPFETSAKDPPEICYLKRWCAMRISISRNSHRHHLCNVLSEIWTATFDLTESFSSAFYLWPSFQWPTEQLFMKLTLLSAALGLNPST